MSRTGIVAQIAGREANARFGPILKELRKRHGYTQACVAGAAGTSEKSVGRWEKGDTGPTKPHLQAVASLFGLTADELIARALSREGMHMTWGEWVGGEGEYSVMRVAVETVGEAPFPAPLFRRSWACRLIKAGISLKYLQMVGGWETLAMLERYLRSMQSEEAVAEVGRYAE